jgi:CRP/FNR family transcriptional regulator, anaerobic regulatory protein
LNNPLPLRDQLTIGRDKLSTAFGSFPARILKAGELLADAGSSNRTNRLRTGWACQSRTLTNGQRVILDVYLPGDVIGIDAGVYARPLEEVVILTAANIESIPAAHLFELMTDRPVALYIAFVLGQRQRRTDRLVTAISALDARGRMATMLLDFYTRLRQRKFVSGSVYNLPLTQMQIGNYLGLTVVHINRVLRSLRDERIVDLEKHCVTILDLDRLMKLAQWRGAAISRPIDGRRIISEAAD